MPAPAPPRRKPARRCRARTQLNANASVSGARIPTSLLPADCRRRPLHVAKYAYVSFKWGLDLWGGKRAAWQAAVGASRAAEVDARAARVELSGNVARAYAQLGYAFTQQDLAQAELERASAARALTQQRVSAGIDNQIQLRQGDAEVASAQQKLALAKRAVVAARSSLSVLLGKGPDRGLRDPPAQRAATGHVGGADQSAGGPARPSRRSGRRALARRGGEPGHRRGEDRVSAEHQPRRDGRRDQPWAAATRSPCRRASTKSVRR